jgi:hypothetical protein
MVAMGPKCQEKGEEWRTGRSQGRPSLRTLQQFPGEMLKEKFGARYVRYCPRFLLSISTVRRSLASLHGSNLAPHLQQPPLFLSCLAAARIALKLVIPPSQLILYHFIAPNSVLPPYNRSSSSQRNFQQCIRDSCIHPFS